MVIKILEAIPTGAFYPTALTPNLLECHREGSCGWIQTTQPGEKREDDNESLRDSR